jgi:hypothetical protein
MRQMSLIIVTWKGRRPQGRRSLEDGENLSF